jgi:serine phosphatase RsbU (regulator of sigma subunit)
VKRIRLTLALLIVLVGLGTVAALDLPWISVPAALLLGSSLLLLLLWAGWRVYQAFLWKVGRRLAFSYFLIGVLPIPLVVMLLSAALYILAGYFLGHLYRDAAGGVGTLLGTRAEAALAAFTAGGRTPGAVGEGAPAVAVYRDGRRAGGDPRLPESWPAWLAEESPATARRPWLALAARQPTLGAWAGDAAAGALAVHTGDLAEELSARSGVWVRVYGPAEPEAGGRVNVEVMGRDIAVKAGPARGAQRAEAFFAERAVTGEEAGWLETWWDRPILYWGEVPGPLRDLASGAVVAESFVVSLNAAPNVLRHHFFSGSAELDVGVWSSLLVFAFLLFDVYAAAAIMAGIMIFALSRAVNRLYQATAAVRGGDFSVRIPVRRRDQVGELQRSFNQMAEHLEQLVATATQKELLEKELAIARDLQKSLIPADLPAGDGIEFATLFEPSAAIGGDYFDILRLGDDRLAVIVADVSGHGLPTGLRMAMLKAALTILAGQETAPQEILRRLDEVVRLDRDGRFFVTATFAVVDFRRGTLEITNAGHPPTYILRGPDVREVMLPGSPLGGLGSTYGSETLELVPGDVVVWLSDGFIEARDDDSEPFGYRGVELALGAVAEAALDAADGIPGPPAAAVRDHLVAAVNRHTRGGHPEDDRTLVVMRYKRAATDSVSPRVA